MANVKITSNGSGYGMKVFVDDIEMEDVEHVHAHPINPGEVVKAAIIVALGGFKVGKQEGDE